MSTSNKLSGMAVETTQAAALTGPLLTGVVLVLVQFDVCEEIRLDRLRTILGARTVAQPSMKPPSPGYVRYERPPVVEHIDELVLESGERLSGEIKYDDYGVLSVIFQLPFSGTGTGWLDWRADGCGTWTSPRMPAASSARRSSGRKLQ